MNNLWVKVVLGIIVLIVGFVIAVMFWPVESEPPKTQKGFYDVAREDQKRLRADPNEKTVKKLQEQASQKQVDEKTVIDTQPVFKQLTPEQDLHAQQLLEYALSFRSMGRLPTVSYKPMIDNCRQIVELYPDSEYAYKAKRILGDIPDRYRSLYNITEDEIIVE
ncbi:MAG: hypothetical protein ACYSRQ_03550 [Planctomycetota bacterium]|jgi:hypothetical protein